MEKPAEEMFPSEPCNSPSFTRHAAHFSAPLIATVLSTSLPTLAEAIGLTVLALSLNGQLMPEQLLLSHDHLGRQPIKQVTLLPAILTWVTDNRYLQHISCSCSSKRRSHCRRRRHSSSSSSSSKGQRKDSTFQHLNSRQSKTLISSTSNL